MLVCMYTDIMCAYVYVYVETKMKSLNSHSSTPRKSQEASSEERKQSQRPNKLCVLVVAQPGKIRVKATKAFSYQGGVRTAIHLYIYIQIARSILQQGYLGC